MMGWENFEWKQSKKNGTYCAYLVLTYAKVQITNWKGMLFAHSALFNGKQNIENGNKLMKPKFG